MVLVSVNYRLAVPGAQPAVGYPDFNEDVAAALEWVHHEIARHGGDPERVLLVGHSAGAAIAAAVVTDPRYLGTAGLTPDWIDCAVLPDTEDYDVAEMALRRDRAGAIYRNAFGDDPSVWVDASPSTHVGDGPLPRDVLVVTRGGTSHFPISVSSVPGTGTHDAQITQWDSGHPDSPRRVSKQRSTDADSRPEPTTASATTPDHHLTAKPLGAPTVR